jgi:hypothetical protein
MVIDGVLGFVDAVITISRNRGIPRVTLAAPWPRNLISDKGLEFVGIRTSEMESIQRHLRGRLAYTVTRSAKGG